MSFPGGPRMSLPMQSLGWGLRPVPFILRAQQKYGDTFTIRIAGEPPWVMLGHPDARQAGLHRRRRTSCAPARPTRSSRRSSATARCCCSTGAEHLRERKLLLPPFHGERMQRYGDLMREIAEAEIAGWPAGAPLQLAPRMQAVTLEVILRAVFGVRDAARLDALRAGLRDAAGLRHRPAHVRRRRRPRRRPRDEASRSSARRSRRSTG